LAKCSFERNMETCIIEYLYFNNRSRIIMNQIKSCRDSCKKDDFSCLDRCSNDQKDVLENLKNEVSSMIEVNKKEL
jgi:hypothetical protein